METPKVNRTMRNKAKQLGLTVKQAYKRPLLMKRLVIKGLTNISPE